MSINKVSQRYRQQYGILSKRVSGFTLIEISIVLLVAILLAALGVPKFTAAIRAQRVSGEANNLLHDLQFARSEALKEGQMVGLCASSNGTTCNGPNWESGWIVYSAGATAGFVAGTSVILRRQTSLTSGDLITTTPANVVTVTFDDDGFSEGLGSAGLLFTLRDSSASTSATRCIWLDVMGRSYIQKYGSSLVSNGQVTACT